MEALKFFASCPKNLEELLLSELKSFNLEELKVRKGGVEFSCAPDKLFALLLESRIASRIFMVWKRFSFKNEKDLYTQALKLPWQELMDPEQSLKISTITAIKVTNAFKNTHFLSLVLKDAIVDKLRQKTSKRPSVDMNQPDYNLTLRVDPAGGGFFRATVSLDLTGIPLSNRGYREEGHKAPLRENLAAALILSTDWDKKEGFVDPFCGSGTLLIEAAWIKAGVCPSYLHLKQVHSGQKVYSFEDHLWFKSNPTFQEAFIQTTMKLLERSEKGLKSLGENSFQGSDINPKYIKQLQRTLKICGIPEKAFTLEFHDALKALPKMDKGILVTNPPYGERLDSLEEAKETLYLFGENLKNSFKNFRAYILISDPELRKAISLRTEQRQTFYNGPIECRLLKYSLY